MRSVPLRPSRCLQHLFDEIKRTEAIVKGTQGRTTTADKIPKMIHLGLIGIAIAFGKTSMPPGQERTRSRIGADASHQRIGTHQTALRAKNFQSLLETIYAAPRDRNMGDDAALPFELQRSCVVVTDLGEGGLDIAAKPSVDRLRRTAYQPQQFIKIVHHHVGHNPALMTHHLHRRQFRIAAKLQYMFDFADLASRQPRGQIPSVRIEPAMEAKYDGDGRSARCFVDLGRRLPVRSKRLFAKRWQPQLDSLRDEARMSGGWGCDDQSIRSDGVNGMLQFRKAWHPPRAGQPAGIHTVDETPELQNRRPVHGSGVNRRNAPRTDDDDSVFFHDGNFSVDVRKPSAYQYNM